MRPKRFAASKTLPQAEFISAKDILSGVPMKCRFMGQAT